MAALANPYASIDLFISSENSARLGPFVKRGDKDSAPFARQVDAWWLAILAGVQLGIRTAISGTPVKFNDGAILASDPWRITHLELLAIAEDDEGSGVGVLQHPRQVIRIATEYANTGFDWLFEQLTGEHQPVLTLTNRLGALASDSAG